MSSELDDLRQFLEINTKVKNLLVQIAPKDIDEYTEYSKIKYIDRLMEYTEILKDYFIVMNELYPLVSDDYIEDFFNDLKLKIYNFSYKNNSIRDFFFENYADISEKVINDVNNSFYLDSSEQFDISSVKTLNELLHVFHSVVVNTGYVFDQIPTVERKSNIDLKGVDSDFARKIFESISGKIKANWSNILSISDSEVLIIAKDLGHATTLEIKLNPDNSVFVSYFIPKICNIDMIKSLKGIDHISVNERSEELGWATGSFQVPYENFISELNNFLNSIPTDADVKQNSKYWPR